MPASGSPTPGASTRTGCSADARPRRNDVDLDALDRLSFWSRVEFGHPDECWPWTQSIGSHGYGQTWDGVTVRLAHRVAWAMWHRQQIPDGMTIDHECRNRICCNPRHLRVMTNLENARDNGMASRTHCPHGHAYTEDNTYRTAKGHRICRRCTLDSQAAERRRAREDREQGEDTAA